MAIWMAYATLAGALFALAAWLLESGVRGRGLAARFVWLAAMLLTIALPALGFLPQRAAPPATGEPTTTITADVDGALLSMLMAAASDGARPVDARKAPEHDYDSALLVGWALMSAVLALALAAALIALRIRRRGWRSASVDGVDVLVAPDAGPAAVGVFAPRIVLPEWALAAQPGALRLMLEHEAEHVRARDPLLIAGAGLLLVAMPWNVALWWQAARLRQAMELDCDARVLRCHPDPQSYASVLLDVARGESRWLLASPAMARHRSLERRIRLLAPRRRRLRSAALAMAAAGGLVLLACGVERPRPDLGEPTPAEAPPPPSPPAPPSVEAPPPAAEDAPPAVEAPPPAVEDGQPAAPDEPSAPPPAPEEPPVPPAEPAFTPMTVVPRIRNVAEVRAALQRFYPPLLRDAGVEGRATVWMWIDEGGRVQRTRLQTSSGHDALDEAAVRVAEIMEFTPARNGEREVAVWIQWPIVFQAEPDGGDASVDVGAADPSTAADDYEMVLFQPSASRPAHYPARLPFVPDVAGTITDFADDTRAMVLWYDPPADIVDRATALSRADGWVLVSDSTQHVTPEFGIRQVRLERNGIERQIVGSPDVSSMAMLVQGPPEPDEDGSAAADVEIF